MKKLFIICLSFLVALNVVGCGRNSNFNDEEQKEILVSDSLSADIEDDNDLDSVGYESTVTLPEDLPVYPGAKLFYDLATGNNVLLWYESTGNANEIIEFYVEAFEGLDLTIDNDATLANCEEFFVATVEGIITIGWLDDETDEVRTPDTPNRGYQVMLDIGAWNSK